MGWRDYANKGDGLGTIGTNGTLAPLGDTPSLSPPAYRPPPVRDARSLLNEWGMGLESVDLNAFDSQVPRNRWIELYDDSCWWLDRFGTDAAAVGWSTSAVFGVTTGQTRGGIVERLGGNRGIQMEGPLARWRAFGVEFLIHKDALASDLAPWWSAMIPDD